MRALEGITVVALEHAIAAPYCTRQLADLGARVIKIERPGAGDFARSYDDRVRGMSSYFVWANRSKESLTLDVKHAEAPKILRALIERADVLVQNLAPGATKRLGLDYATLSKLHPKLIVCDISGYGDDGPYAQRKAYDLLVQSESGFVSVNGTPEQPAKSGPPVADISAATAATTSILAALIERGRTGRGKRIEIAMLEAMVEWMGYPLYYAFDGAPPPPRTGASHATIYPYGAFAAANGESVMLGIQNEREWTQFCAVVLGRPEVATDARFDTNAKRSANRCDLDRLIAPIFDKLTVSQLRKRLDAAGIANAQVNDMHAVWKHPQLAARERWQDVDTPVGRVPALIPPGMDDPRMDAVPRVGEHTQRILSELGYDASAIDRLRAAGAI
ncbi:MAG TPA: CaiB/BaiF CoA-transferase family protein [Burkholderiales bacterium]|nr:CaiB/BaiF CoA-transferase family protein [Burkholderiales bacterium]